ncbi:MAG: class I SAM-dependent methyltransferase [Deinococcaceae bacterium]
MQTINGLKDHVEDLVFLDQLASKEGANAYFHRIIANTHHMCEAIAACEQQDISRNDILNSLQKTRAVYQKSPFLRHLHQWPRGYAGDFESIEYLYGNKESAPKYTAAHVIEYHALNSAIAQQHRNKVQIQAQVVVEGVTQAQKPLSVLSVACGSSLDLAQIQYVLQSQEVRVVLNDIDPDALERSRANLSGLDRCTFIQGNILSQRALIQNEGPFDVIICGGLFDYLSDKQVRFLIHHLYTRCLKPGGQLFFTNLLKGNPFRVWMSYLANWDVIERSQDEMRALIDPAASFSMGTDPTGLTLWVKMNRPR